MYWILKLALKFAEVYYFLDFQIGVCNKVGTKDQQSNSQTNQVPACQRGPRVHADVWHCWVQKEANKTSAGGGLLAPTRDWRWVCLEIYPVN